ncbi:Uncharacterized protein TCM_012510 [Theobroma cacao]|uniref:Transmembrane protein n=1 Tax=Theobroma cacao TaxID=3641 RepID=A0A061FUF1_THECC|nr:Uncharacterized protein TCM_012510 [Theobroma cacao]
MGLSSFFRPLIVFILIISVLAMQMTPISCADLKLRRLGSKPMPNPPPAPARNIPPL